MDNTNKKQIDYIKKKKKILLIIKITLIFCLIIDFYLIMQFISTNKVGYTICTILFIILLISTIIINNYNKKLKYKIEAMDTITKSIEDSK